MTEPQPTLVSVGLEFTAESMAMYTDCSLALKFHIFLVSRVIVTITAVRKWIKVLKMFAIGSSIFTSFHSNKI